ncbi:MAG TPA: hypothetical protein VEL28_01865 [Candidatus Binatia bacterium]|nr:hypothetical protein [Candidatus Binatia bacterium]
MTRPLLLERHLAWTPGAYAVWRFVFGAWLCVHFLQLLPWSTELWSNVGVLPDAADSPWQGRLHLYAISDRPLFVTITTGAAGLLSAMLAVGIGDRIAAVALWYILAGQLARNPLIENPGLAVMGWLLLAHALVPSVRAAMRELPAAWPPQPRWQMPPLLWAAAWTVMAASYTYSGYAKLQSPSWVDGTALMRVLDNPLARDTALRAMLHGLHEYVLGFLTWGALALELLYAPLALLRALRPWLWLAMVLMQLGMLMVVDLVDLSLAMIMMHFFTLNPGWFSLRVPHRVRHRLREWRPVRDATA